MFGERERELNETGRYPAETEFPAPDRASGQSETRAENEDRAHH